MILCGRKPVSYKIPVRRRRFCELRYNAAGNLSGFGVRCHIVLIRGVADKGRALHRLHYSAVDVGETYGSSEKRRHCNLVGRIDHAGRVAAATKGEVSQRHTGEACGVGFGKCKVEHIAQPQRRLRCGKALAVAESQSYGHAHVGHSELCLHRAVGEFHHGVYHRLRMHYRCNLLGTHVEKPASLDNLERLVDHRGRVDGDFRAHVPVRVAQGIGHSHSVKHFGRSVAEGASGGRDYEAAYIFVAFAAQALVYGRMLRIHRYDLRPASGKLAGDDVAGHYECLLVGQGNVAPGFYGAQGGGETAVTYGGRNHRVEIHLLHRVVDGFLSCGGRYAERSKSLLEFGILALIGDYCH